MSNCVFCRIVAKEIPATVVHEDEHTLAFMDIGQVNPGPRAGGGEEACRKPLRAGRSAGGGGVPAAAARWRARSAPRSSRRGYRCIRRTAGRPGRRCSICHIHLVPRHEGDGMALTWPVKNPPREKLAEYAEKIRAIA